MTPTEWQKQYLAAYAAVLQEDIERQRATKQYRVRAFLRGAMQGFIYGNAIGAPLVLLLLLLTGHIH